MKNLNKMNEPSITYTSSSTPPLFHSLHVDVHGYAFARGDYGKNEGFILNATLNILTYISKPSSTSRYSKHLSLLSFEKVVVSYG